MAGDRTRPGRHRADPARRTAPADLAEGLGSGNQQAGRHRAEPQGTRRSLPSSNLPSWRVLLGRAASRRALTAGSVTALLATGGICIGVGVSAQVSPPQPPAPAADARSIEPPTSTAGAGPAALRPSSGTRAAGRAHRAGATPSATPPPTGLPRSVPVHLDIPAIGVDTGLLRLGLGPDHTVQVPPLEEKDSKAGWYQYSPTPGQDGPAVILGHVDSAEYGPAVFFKLGALRPGDTVSVRRADGSLARFRITKVASYPKSAFPTETVYGPVDHPALRLITCGGTFDPAARSYESNIVVFADLID